MAEPHIPTSLTNMAAGESVPPTAGKCRICDEDTWRQDQTGPVHPCCAIHAVENPDRPCLPCEASKKARRRRSL